MKKRNYYYIVSGLPDLDPDQPAPPVSIPEFRAELNDLLQPEDAQWIPWVFYRFDHINLLNLLENREADWHPLGNFDPEELETRLKYPGQLPEYMNRFAEAFKSETSIYPDKTWENQLAQLFYEYATEHTSGFLNEWFRFDNYLKNLTTGWNIRQFPYASKGQFIGSPELVDTMERITARDFGLSGKLHMLETILQALEQDDLFKMEKTLQKVRWNYIDELNTFHYFSVENILGFLLKCAQLYRWQFLDAKKGSETIRRFMQEIEETVELKTPEN